MHKAQEQVREFHVAMNQSVGETIAIRDAELRAFLIIEEAIETVVGIVGSKRALKMIEAEHAKIQNKIGSPSDPGSEPDLVEAVDGMCDLLYVTYGTAVAFGVDLESFYDEVHRANLAKASGEVRADGKRLKPPGWKPPRIKEMLVDAIVAQTNGESK